MLNPTDPMIFNDDWTINEEGFTDTKNYSLLSPKAYIKYSAYGNISIALTLSQNVQSHSFADVYQGFNTILHNIISYLPLKTGNLKPLVTTQYELNLFYQASENFISNFALYNKRTNNQISD